MGRPRLLDLFAGAGGAAAGYVRAGFEVTGVDTKPQPRYLLSGATGFIQGDALEYVREHGHEFDAIHASPPCQMYSALRCLPWLRDREYWDSIPPTLAALEVVGLPWVVENVERAPLPNGVTLCGTMFDLRVYRHRRFASNVLLLAPPHQKHREVIGSGRRLNDRAGIGESGMVSLVGKGARRPVEQRNRRAAYESGGMVTITGDVGSYCRDAMGVDWPMTGAELSQAIPPAYTEFLGRQLRTAVENGA